MVAEAVARCDGDGIVDRERRAREGWDVVLSHPCDVAGTSRLVATGDTLDLTRFHDVVCVEADTLAALGDTDELGARKARALGVLADQQARLDLTSLLGTSPGEAEHAEVRDTALDRRAAKTTLYLHACLNDLLGHTEPSTGTAESLGPVTLDLLQEWAGRTRVTTQPVLHVATEDRWAVDRHDPPPRMAEEVRLRDEVCVFPARPHRRISRPCADDITARRPPDDGDTNEATPANTSGTALPAPPPSSPATAPSRSHSPDIDAREPRTRRGYPRARIPNWAI